MEADIPSPNPAIAALLLSPEMRNLMAQRGEVALAAYLAVVNVDTGQLASTAHVETYVEGDRWKTSLVVGGGEAEYAPYHEGGTRTQTGEHDLNRVLNVLAAL